MKKIIIAIFSLSALTLTIGAAQAASTSQKLKGKILLQVESKGEAWYVDPSTGMRNSLGKPTDALDVMKKVGIGITNANLQKIPLADKNLANDTDTDNDGLSDSIEIALGTDKTKADTDSDGQTDKAETLAGTNPINTDTKLILNSSFAKNQAGKILLQVESRGEAWYVNPTDNKRYFLGRPADAFNIMRALGLGISNSNLDKITITRQTKTATSTPNIKGGPVHQLKTAEENDRNGLMGTIIAFNKPILSIKTISGANANSTETARIYSVTINDSTTYSKDRENGTIDDIVVGARAMITGTINTSDKTAIASRIDIVTKEPEKLMETKK